MSIDNPEVTPDAEQSRFSTPEIYATIKVNGSTMLEHLEDLTHRYDSGERIRDEAIVAYVTLNTMWDVAIENNKFSHLDGDFMDSLVAIESLIQKPNILARYLEIFGHTPEPIIKPNAAHDSDILAS